MKISNQFNIIDAWIPGETGVEKCFIIKHKGTYSFLLEGTTSGGIGSCILRDKPAGSLLEGEMVVIAIPFGLPEERVRSLTTNKVRTFAGNRYIWNNDAITTEIGQAIIKEFQEPFVTTWETTSSPESITLPLIDEFSYNMVVDWGDGNSDTITAFDQAERIHSYDTAGIYDITITGLCETWAFWPVVSSKDNILDVKYWGNIGLTSCEFMFFECSNLDISATDSPNLADVTSLKFMFDATSVTTSDFSNWDTSTITDMNSTFSSSPFEGNISTWDVGNVTDMALMFSNCPAFTGDLSEWDVRNVETMLAMFQFSTFNSDISKWNLKNAKSLQGMFTVNSAFNQDISSWDVKNVESMNSMFEAATAFNQNLSGWFPRSVTDAGNMFNTSALSTTNYDLLLNGWSSKDELQLDVDFGASITKYSTAGQPGRDKLIVRHNWTITDAGLA